MQKRAFTLIEVTIVVVILGILAAIALPRLQQQQELAHFSRAVTVVRSFHTAQERYRLDNAGYAAACGSLDVSVNLSGEFDTLTCLATGAVSVRRSSGKCTGYVLTANQNGTLTLSNFPAACSAIQGQLNRTIQ
jgi:type IV pilus assembly protein PilE